MNFNSKNIISLLIVLELITLFLAYKSYSNKDIEKIEETSNTIRFAMYVQNDGSSSYSEVKNQKAFPENKRININKSYCKDSNNEIVPNVLTTDYTRIYVKSNKTLFCNIYFDNFKILYDILKKEYSEENNNLVELYDGDYNNSDHSNIYYYNGSNNSDVNAIHEKWNVVFGGFCWQMFRTTENHGVKLLYNGEPTLGTDSNGNTTYDCSTGRSNHEGLGARIKKDRIASLGSNYYYSTGYTIEDNKYKLKSDSAERLAWSMANSQSLVGKYTCFSTNVNNLCDTLYLIESYINNSSGYVFPIVQNASYYLVGDSIQFNEASDSIAYNGYMYGDLTKTIEDNHNQNASLSFYSSDFLNSSLESKYYSKEYTYGEACAQCYQLTNPVLGSEIVGTEKDYSKLKDYYTLRTTNSNNTNSSIYKYIGYLDSVNGSSGRLYYIEFNNGTNEESYNKTLRLSESVRKDGNGNYVLDGTIKEVKLFEWWDNYSEYENYYITSDIEGITSPVYISTYGTSPASISYGKFPVLYGDTVKYSQITGKYTIDTEDANAKHIISWDFDYSKLNEYTPYTCWNDSGTCETLSYVKNSNGSGNIVLNAPIYYELENGQLIEELFDNMLQDNSKNSIAKTALEGWYSAKLLDYDNFIDHKEIYCNDREYVIGKTSNTVGYVYFSQHSQSLKCYSEEDSFTSDEEIGNGLLNYSVGLLTGSEASFGNRQLFAKDKDYWLLNPGLYTRNSTVMYVKANNNNNIYSNPTDSLMGIRPVISLADETKITLQNGTEETRAIEYITGNGSTTNPYVVITDFN